MATHSSIFAGKPQGQRNLEAHSPGGCKESDTTENTHTQGKSKFIFLFFCSLPVCYFGCSVFMLTSVCLHGQTKLEQEVLLCVIQGLQQRRGCLFMQSDSMVQRQVPGP